MASKSLGTLTLDLIANTAGFVRGMDQSERASAKWRKKVKKDIEAAASAAKIGLGVITGAFTASVTTMANSGRDLIDAQMKLARSLDTSYNSISALSVAFADNGINNWEGSLARVNRRLGAAEKGMGPAVKAVKALNLDLNELSSLEADERLARIADAIKETGVSSELAARYAQDLGFEQREAGALFMAGGDALRGYREEAERLGLTLSDIDAAKVESANDAFGRMDFIITGMQQKIAIGVVPSLNKMAETINDPNTISNMQALADAAVRMANASIELGSDFTKFGINLGQEIGVIAEGIGGLDLEEQIARVKSALENPSERLRLFGPGGIVEYFSEEELNAELERLQGLLEEKIAAESAVVPPVEVPVEIDYPPEQKKKLEALRKTLSKLELKVKSNSGENLLPVLDKIREIKKEIAAIESMKLVPDTIDYSISAYDKFREQWDDLVKVQNDYKRQMQEIAATELSAIERKELMARADRDRIQALKDLRSAEIEQLASRIQGGQDTGPVRMDFINREGEFAPERGRSSQAFEEAARRFADSIDSGMLSPEGAARQLSLLDSMAGKLGALGEGFDTEGMKAAVQNLAAQTRDMFAAGGGGKPLTAEEMERVFREAQEKAAAMEKEQRESWMSIKKIDELLQKTLGEENKKPTAIFRFEVDQNGKKSFADITGTGDPQSIADILKLAAAGG